MQVTNLAIPDVTKSFR